MNNKERLLGKKSISALLFAETLGSVMLTGCDNTVTAQNYPVSKPQTQNAAVFIQNYLSIFNDDSVKAKEI